MGSCFAREVENILIARSLPLLLAGHGVPAEHFETWDGATGRGGGRTQPRRAEQIFRPLDDA
jgi:hypothetical protein